MKCIFFVGLLFLSLDLSANYIFWIDPSSSVYPEEVVGPHRPAAVFNIRDLNPGFKNGMEIGFATDPSAMKSFSLYFLNSQGQRVCTNGQPSLPNDCYYHVYLYTNVFFVLSDDIQSVVIGSSCSQNCMSQVDPNYRILIYPKQNIVKNAFAKKVCPDGQLTNGPIYPGDHLRIFVQTDPGLSCEESELVQNSSETDKYYTSQTNADGEGIFTFDINSLPASANHFWVYAKGKNSQGQIRPIGGRTVDWDRLIDPEIYSVDVYQVIKNPRLYSPTTAIDLVAGKNADIIVQTNLINADITGSVLEWKGKDGTTFNTYSPKSNLSNQSGEIIFEIDPVPKSNIFVGGETTFSVKILLNDGCGGKKQILTPTQSVHIRKTKPIHLKFTKIVNPLFYESPDEIKMNLTKTKGVELIKLLFPIANDEITQEDTFLPILGAPPLFGLQSLDWFSLNMARNVFNVFNSNKATHLVAFVTPEYVADHGQCETAGCWLGITAFENPYLFVQHGELSTLAHELAHTYCVRFDGKFDCRDSAEVDISHSFSANIVDSIFSNFGSVALDTNRGILADRKNLMYYRGINGVNEENGWWLDSQGYLQLFHNNLAFLAEKKLYSNYMNILGTVNESGAIENIQTLMVNNSQVQSSKLSIGDYKIDYYDKYERLIYSNFINKKTLISDRINGASRESIFDAIIEVPYNALSIKITNQANGKNNFETHVSIPVDLIRTAIKYIPDAAISLDKQSFMSRANSILDLIRTYALRGKFDSANELIKGNLSTLFRESLKSSYDKVSLNDLGLYEMQKIVTYSIVKLEASQSVDSNPFFELQELYRPKKFEKSIIQINLLKKPISVEYQIVFDVFFNDQLVELNRDREKIYAISTYLDTGLYFWNIKAYSVNKKLWNGYISAISTYNKELQELEIEIAKETKVQIVDSIRNKISEITKKIQHLELEKSKLKIELGKTVSFKVEVIE